MKAVKPLEIYEFPNKDFCVAFLRDNQTFFTFDKEDRDIVEKHSWREDRDGYIHGHVVGKNFKDVRLHRVIKEKYEDISGKLVDHKNHIVKDNRNNNLRACTKGENQLNRISTSNTGYKNISYNKKIKKYRVKFSENVIGIASDLESALNIKNNYIKNNPNEFYYDTSQDISNIEYKISVNGSPYDAFYIADGLTPPNTIKPFIFVN